MRMWLTLCLLGYSFFATAGPGPFGFQIDKSKYNEVKINYSLTHIKDLDVADVTYSAYSVETKVLKFDGLHNGTLYFEKKSGVLKCVLLKLDVARYADIDSILGKKYKTIDKANTPLNDKYAVFEKSGTIIKIDAPVLSSLMRLIYINKDIYTILNSKDTPSTKKLDEEAAQL